MELSNQTIHKFTNLSIIFCSIRMGGGKINNKININSLVP